jgi:hypothetical protein
MERVVGSCLGLFYMSPCNVLPQWLLLPSSMLVWTGRATSWHWEHCWVLLQVGGAKENHQGAWGMLLGVVWCCAVHLHTMFCPSVCINSSVAALIWTGGDTLWHWEHCWVLLQVRVQGAASTCL